MLLGESQLGDAPRLLFIKSRIERSLGQPSAPALGILSLGAVARLSGWHVKAIDTYLEDDPIDAIRRGVHEFAPRVVGLSALTSESRSMHEHARVVRACTPDAVILAGGAHASAYPRDCLENPAIDAVVLGEGEATLRDVLERIARCDAWQSAPGLALRSPLGIRNTAPRPAIEELDSLPFPAWDLTSIDAYARRKGQSLAGLRRYVPIMTSRGCPYRCTYCHDIQGKRFRGHSPDYVIRMIDDVGRRYGVVNFDIVDDIFNFDAERMDSICEALLQRDQSIRFTFPNGVRADRMTVAQVDKLARAGCEYVGIAIESASPRIQKRIKKHLRFDKLLPIIEAFSTRNVLTAGFFMLGFPTETEEEVRSTINLALQSELHVALFFVVIPFGGTELHAQLEADGLAPTGPPTDLYVLHKRNLSEVPDATFFRMRREAYLRFYLDPRRMLRVWKATPRRAQLPYLAFLALGRDTFGLHPELLFEPAGRLSAFLGGVVRGEGRDARSKPERARS